MLSFASRPKQPRLQRTRQERMQRPSSATLVHDDLAPLSIAPTSPSRYGGGRDLMASPQPYGVYPLPGELVPTFKTGTSLRESLGPPSAHLMKRQRPPEPPKRGPSLRFKAMGKALRRTFSRKQSVKDSSPVSSRQPSLYTPAKGHYGAPLTPLTPGMSRAPRSPTTSQSSSITVGQPEEMRISPAERSLMATPPFDRPQPNTPAFEDYTVPHHHSPSNSLRLDRRPSTPHPQRLHRHAHPTHAHEIHQRSPTTRIYNTPGPPPVDNRKRIFVGPWHNRRGDLWMGIDGGEEPRILVASADDEFHQRFTGYPEQANHFANPTGDVIDIRTLCMIHQNV